jgi:hypothetical protein
MRALDDILRKEGARAAFEEMGLDFAALFLTELGDNPYRHHQWLVKRTPTKVIVNAIPGEGDQDHLFWEEWYVDAGKAHHHVLSRWAPARYDGIFDSPARDDEHPPLSFGKRWYWTDDADMRPWLLRR